MMNAKLLAWIYNIVNVLFFLREDVTWVEITILNNAVDKGAVCLDGSPPAYHLSPGFGSGANNWLVFLQGGAWCNNVTTCLEHSRNAHGSSKYMRKLLSFHGILSDKQKFNPDFYNWNKVLVRYCDGSSFTGDVDLVDADTNLHYRGARIWAAVLAELRAKGMNPTSKNALLSGCSAGGLSTMLHCDSFRDNFRSNLPFETNVKCISDGGFFINVKDIIETDYIKGFYNDVVTTHHSVGSLPHACLSRLPPGMCFFPQYMAQHIRTPLFILNAAYDSSQIQYNLVPDIADPSGAWNGCKHDIENCSSSQLQTMQGFRLNFLRALMGLGRSSSRGLFINSCYAHCQTELQDIWFSSNSPMLDKTPIAKAVGDWYFNRKRFQKIDCAYPCDSTCVNSSD